MVLNTQKLLQVLMKKTPYLDKAPNYERDYKTGKYIITNITKNAEQNSDDAQNNFTKSADHIENYINFTNLHSSK
jgi:hypothetical protein